jgi:alpha-ribazole phosphatase
MKVVLIRHPKPQIEPGICYGQLDMPADADDLERVVANLKLRAAPIACFSSPLIRAHSLATAMQMHGWPEPSVHNDLMEMSFGDWENRSWNDIDRGEIDAWAANMLHFIPPGGESVFQLAHRSAAAIRECLKQTPPAVTTNSEDYVAIFCHAGVLHVAPTVLRGEELPVGQKIKIAYEYGHCVEVFVPHKA